MPKDSLGDGQRSEFIDQIGQHFKEGEKEQRRLIDSDVVLMRQDPPFDMQYITATHVLDRIIEALVVNNPTEVRNA